MKTSRDPPSRATKPAHSPRGRSDALATPRDASAVDAFPRSWRFALIAIVFVLSTLPFLPALSQGYVEWDDDYNFIHNPNWRGLSADNLRWMFTTTHLGHYQPLAWLSFGIEFASWGESPQRMHLINVLLHALNAVLLARLATRLIAAARGSTGRVESAADWMGGVAAALFFSLHPLRVESVAWATERRDVLSAFFLLACVLCWLRTRDIDSRRAWWWLAALACYALSLLSKAWGMTLPALLVALEVYPLRRAQPTIKGLARAALAQWPFVPLAVGFAVKAAAAQRDIAAAVSWDEHGLVARLVQAAWGTAFYLWKTLWPSGLSPLYELEAVFDPLRRDYVIATALVIVMSAALWLARKRWPAGLAAWVAFLILVSPVLGLFQSGAQKAADRYTYIACMPLAVLAGAGVSALIARRARRSVTDPVIASTGVALLAAWSALAFVALRQTRVWKDSESLWRQVIAVEPKSYIAHHNLAITVGNQGRVPEAIALEVRGVELHSGKGNVDARQYLGTLYQRSGQPDQALATWIDAFRVDPEHANVLASLSQELARRGERERLYALFDEVLAKDPSRVALRVEYAGRLLQDRRAKEAEAQLQAAVTADPRYVPALIALGRLHVFSGRVAEAEPLLALAVRLDATQPDALAELGAVRAAQGRMDEAFALWGEALNRAPDHARANALVRQYSSQTGGGAR